MTLHKNPKTDREILHNAEIYMDILSRSVVKTKEDLLKEYVSAGWKVVKEFKTSTVISKGDVKIRIEDKSENTPHPRAFDFVNHVEVTSTDYAPTAKPSWMA